MEIKIRHIERQNVQARIVCQGAVGLVHAAQVVEISSLPKWARLIGVAPIDRGLSGEVDQPVSDAELARDIARMLFSWTCDSVSSASMRSPIGLREHQGASREGIEDMRRQDGPAKLSTASHGKVWRHTRVSIAGGACDRKADMVGVDAIDVHVGPRRTGVEGSSWRLRAHGHDEMRR